MITGKSHHYLHLTLYTPYTLRLHRSNLIIAEEGRDYRVNHKSLINEWEYWQWDHFSFSGAVIFPNKDNLMVTEFICNYIYYHNKSFKWEREFKKHFWIKTALPSTKSQFLTWLQYLLIKKIVALLNSFEYSLSQENVGLRR